MSKMIVLQISIGCISVGAACAGALGGALLLINVSVDFGVRIGVGLKTVHRAPEINFVVI
jgi:hypothetical protein